MNRLIIKFNSQIYSVINKQTKLFTSSNKLLLNQSVSFYTVTVGGAPTTTYCIAGRRDGILKNRQNISKLQCRFKYNKKSKKEEIEENYSNVKDFEDYGDGKDNRVLQVKLSSLRMDTVIKSGLGMSRNKIEATFYDSKLRVNGKKILKKSSTLHVGDEIDVIKGLSPMNPEHIIVGRIEILSVSPEEDCIAVVMRRFKSLAIENYDGENVWKAQSSD